MPETAPLDFTEDDITWVTSNLSVTANTLGLEAIDIRNWLVFFGCALEELSIVFIRLADWMANLYLHLDAYSELITCRLLALDKIPGVRPVGIGEALCRSLSEHAMRAPEDPVKTVHGHLQLCAGLEDGIEG